MRDAGPGAALFRFVLAQEAQIVHVAARLVQQVHQRLHLCEVVRNAIGLIQMAPGLDRGEVGRRVVVGPVQFLVQRDRLAQVDHGTIVVAQLIQHIAQAGTCVGQVDTATDTAHGLHGLARPLEGAGQILHGGVAVAEVVVGRTDLLGQLQLFRRGQVGLDGLDAFRVAVEEEELRGVHAFGHHAVPEPCRALGTAPGFHPAFGKYDGFRRIDQRAVQGAFLLQGF
ncbi:MAG: hypothetical protein GFGODING_00121 [Flavobacteriales bacterium]|nr:hypothetical protein [Flavobacteriales bacterium]